MRVLQVSHYYDKVGGAEVYFRALARLQAERGHVVGVFAGHAEREVDEELLRLVRREVFDINQIYDDPALDQALIDYGRAFRPDIVHVHNLYSFPASAIVALASIGAPIVMTLHDLALLCTNSWGVLPDGRICGGGPGRKCLEEGCHRHAYYDERNVLVSALRYRLVKEVFDGFVSPSNDFADRFRANGFAPVEVIPYWVDANHGDSETHEVREPQRLVYVGRLTPEKGLDHLVRAMRFVKERLPTARLDVVGGGVEEDALERLADREGVADVVEFHGRVSHAEVARYLARAAVQVVPSIWSENSPVAIYESLVAGLPTVASRIGGIPDLVRDGETGFLVRPRDPRDLADKLLRVLEDPALRERLSQGCRDAARRYTDAGEHLDRIDGVYRDTLARSPSPRASEAVMGGWMDLLYSIQSLHIRHADLFAFPPSGGRVRRTMNRALDALFAMQRKLTPGGS